MQSIKVAIRLQWFPWSPRYENILANRPDLVGTVPIWRPKPDVPPDNPKKPIRPVLSRSTPPKHDFKPAFCLFSLFFSRNSSFFCVFWPFLMYSSVVDSYPNVKKYINKRNKHCQHTVPCHGNVTRQLRLRLAASDRSCSARSAKRQQILELHPTSAATSGRCGCRGRRRQWVSAHGLR